MRIVFVTASVLLLLAGCATAESPGSLVGTSATAQKRAVHCKDKAGQFCITPGGAVKVARP